MTTRRETLAILGALSLPLPWSLDGGATTAAQPLGEIPPDLVNLYEPLSWIGRENAPRLSFLDERFKSIDAWKKTARPVFLERLSYDPKPLPLAAELVSREEREGYSLEVVRISATPAYDIPAWILIPARRAHRSERAPGIVALHCHGGQYYFGHEKVLASPQDPPSVVAVREHLYGGRSYAELLARRGFVVIVIDALYFGVRRLRVENVDATRPFTDAVEAMKKLAGLAPGTAEWIAAVNGACGRYETLTAKTILAAGATWPGILTWDDRRSIDYLCSRPEVDRGRIGCLGLSLGGIRAAQLIAADPRVKAACVIAWMSEWSPMLRNHTRSHTWMAYTPGLYSSLDLPDAAALTMPGALLVQQCERDRLFPRSAMQGAIDKLTKIYAKAGIPERFKGVFHDEPHSFTPRMQDEAFDWLERWLS